MTVPSGVHVDADATTRVPLPQTLHANPIVAVLRANDARAYDQVIDVLAAHGVVNIELTLTTPGTFAHLPGLSDRMGDDVSIGVGTVTSLDDAHRAIDAGARYLVTPVARHEIVAAARPAGVPVILGGLTPTELFGGWEAGATAVKIFPAQTVGAKYGSHLRGPFPDIQFVPSGGISLEDIPNWLAAGAVAVSLGGPLVGDALDGGSMDALAQRAQAAVTACNER